MVPVSKENFLVSQNKALSSFLDIFRIAPYFKMGETED
jgi:hypothetical protein